jgi:23S rRNA pseudouridine2605 synthase
MNIAKFNGFLIQTNKPNYSKLKVSISEGQNRELRRFFAHFNREVLDLKRIEFGGISLNNLPTQKHRYLTRSEYTHLKEFLDEM